MADAEITYALQGIIGDTDIHHVIDNRLVPSGYPGGGAAKYFVDGLPEVVIRHTPYQTDLEATIQAAQASNQLPRHGIPALPFIPLQHHGEIYVVTRKLHGVQLRELLSPQAPESFYEHVDQQWSKIPSYLTSGRENAHHCALDIYDAFQYMVGESAADTNEAITLVDFLEMSIDYSQQPERGAYERALLSASTGLIEIEQALHRRLALARTTLHEALDKAQTMIGAEDSYSTRLRRAHINVVKHCLETDTVVKPDDKELIARFA
jgi:hypothetical protein